MLNILYRTLPGRLLLKLLASPVFSKIGGLLLNTRLSAYMVGPFVRKYKICMDDYEKREYKCLRLEGSNLRLGGIAPITWAVPSFRVSMRLAVSVAWQKGN